MEKSLGLDCDLERERDLAPDPLCPPPWRVGLRSSLDLRDRDLDFLAFLDFCR